MRKRLAKKVLKRPWRYSVGSWKAACTRLNVLRMPFEGGFNARDEWVRLDAAVLAASRARMRTWQDISVMIWGKT